MDHYTWVATMLQDPAIFPISSMQIWLVAGSGSSSESVELAAARSSSSLSLSNSFVVVPELRSEAPLLKLQFTQHKAGEQHHLQHALPGRLASAALLA